jgi:hypothetical protein
MLLESEKGNVPEAALPERWPGRASKAQTCKTIGQRAA